MDLAELRQEIDKIDDSLVSLFGARMDIAAKIAEVKKQTGAPIFVPAGNGKSFRKWQKRPARRWPTIHGCCIPCCLS